MMGLHIQISTIIAFHSARRTHPEGFPLELHAMAAIENSDKKIAIEHRAAKIKIGFESE